MGACASSPAAGAAAAGGEGGTGGAALHEPQLSRDSPPALTRQHHRDSTNAADQPITDEDELHYDMLEKVTALQQQLVEVSATPLVGLQEAAEMLLEQTQADLVGIWVVPKGEPAASVLLAAQGRGAAALQRDIVLRHQPLGSGSSGWQQRIGAPCFMQVSDTACPEAPRVEPADLWRGPEALRSFVQAPIGPPSAPLGVLLLASAEPGAFGSAIWQMQVQLAGTGLLPHVRHAQVARMAQLLRRLDGLEDRVAMIGALLRGAEDFMLRSCSLRTTPRLALLQPGGADAGPKAARGEAALLFELPPPAARASLLDGGAQHGSSFSCSAGNTTSAASEDEEEVVASRLKLHTTLLQAAIAQQQARFVTDVGKYMQTSVRPARDIFSRSSRVVSSIVVMPLVAAGQPPLGGLYFALDAPCEFTNIQDTLLGLVSGVVPLLYHRLAGQAGALESAVLQAQRRAALVGPGGAALQGAASGVSECDVINVAGSTLSSSSGSECQQQQAGWPQSGSTVSGRLPTITSSDRLNTEAMLALLQQDIRSKSRHRRGEQACSELAVGEVLGCGRCGTVFKGVWHRVPVAVKVMPARSCEREAMQDAVEMAVLSSVQHPNIVTVYACLTDMVEVSDGVGSRSVSASRSLDLRTYYRRLAPEEDHDDVDTYNVVIMEPCDRGTLRDAIGRGLLHQKLPGGALGVRFPHLLEVLLDVAYALQYLHSMQLVHGDLTLDSVLLKADRTRPLGVTPKLSEFGLTRILHDSMPNAGGAAAPAAAAHQAPEVLEAGGQVTTAVDAYAFGILMYEAYTMRRAYSGVPAEQVAARVRDQGLRPRFHGSTPASYAQLAHACWAADPAARPTVQQIAEGLERITAKLSPPAI